MAKLEQTLETVTTKSMKALTLYVLTSVLEPQNVE